MTIHITEEFQHALDLIAAGENVLISGKAGTGKSTLLRTFLSSCENTNMLLTAPTGVAALNIDGYTIHRAFGFHPSLTPDDLMYNKKWHPSENVQSVLFNTDILVVDEISMVRADLFDLMDAALQIVHSSPKPFGGVQLVLVGDLLQLPPVVGTAERELFTTTWETPYFFSAHCYPSLTLHNITLSTVWRQRDTTFIDILNEVREGNVTDATLDTLNAHVDPCFDPPHDWVTLASLNSTANRINTGKLAALDAPVFVSHAEFTGEATDRFFSGAATLHYAVGARVMTIINDPAERFVNGSFAQILDADEDQITVRLDNTRQIVTLSRHTWQVNTPVMDGGRITSEPTGSITQFPVILAWAITIHKSQGKTLPKCFINLSGGTATDGQFYVALSRAVSLEYLRFSAPVQPRHIRANNTLVRTINRQVSANLTTSRYVFIAFNAVSFMISEHIARIHVLIYEGDALVASFGSWINPNADLGEFGRMHGVPPLGLALAPSLADFWPLLLRQAAGGIVIG